jgi:hypothetical protein
MGAAVLAWCGGARGGLRRALTDHIGQGIMEYAVLLGAIALIAALALYGADFDFTAMVTEIQDCISFDSNCG